MTETEKIAQIKMEYEEGRSFLEERKLRSVDQLKLLNNLNRPDESISSTMLFSFFNRVFSNLYTPTIQVKFTPNEDSEQNNVSTLNKLARSDFQDMEMDMIEYDWTWDACFFARGYCETLKFNKTRKIMEPAVINPLMFGYDPFFEDPSDWRYYWKWISRSGAQLNRLIAKKVITGIKTASDIASGMDDQVWNYKVLREQAKDVTSQGPDSTSPMPSSPKSGNGVYQILEHYTYFDTMDKYVVWTDKDITKILREEKLELNDDLEVYDEKTKTYGSKWPITIREIFREPHSSYPVSVPDLVEDKHRAESVLLNLAYIAAKDEATPIYVYKEGAIAQESQMLQRQINQHIEISEDYDNDAGTAIQPLRKSPGLSSSTMNLLNILKNEAAEAVGTSQVAPIVSKGKKTATDASIQQQLADLVGALQSRIIGRSERQFWTAWYQRYVNNMKDGDQKILAVTNSQYSTFERIALKDIRTALPPKAVIFSSREAEFKETVERRELAQQFPILQQSMAPEQFKLFLKFVYFPKFQTFDSETMDLLYPASVDEMKAEQENDMLAKGVLPPIEDSDNHQVHLYIHSRVKNTAEKWAHVLTHEKLLADQIKQQQQTQQEEPNGANMKDKVSENDLNNNEGSVPLKGAMNKMDKESKLAVKQ